MKRKEIFWLIGTAIFVLLLHFAFFGFDGLKSDSTIDINIHDTYFVFANFHFIILFSFFIFFGVYIVRMLHRNFKNLTANLIFIISGLCGVWTLTGMITILNSYLSVTETTESNVTVTNAVFQNISTILYITQTIIVILIAYSGFKTGRNYKNGAENAMHNKVVYKK